MANEKKCKLTVNHFTAKKSGKDCYALVLDLGYTKKFLSFDVELCATVLGISVYDLPSLPLDTVKEVVSWVNK